MQLEVTDLKVNYHNIAALKGISFTVPDGCLLYTSDAADE